MNCSTFVLLLIQKYRKIDLIHWKFQMLSRTQSSIRQRYSVKIKKYIAWKIVWENFLKTFHSCKLLNHKNKIITKNIFKRTFLLILIKLLNCSSGPDTALLSRKKMWPKLIAINFPLARLQIFHSSYNTGWQFKNLQWLCLRNRRG